MSTQSTQTTSQSASPWAVQQPYLTQAFGQASTNLNNANSNTYTGQQVAQFTPDQLATFKNMIGFGGDMSGATTSGAVGSNTANLGYGALSDALGGLSNFKPSGSTQSNIDAATAYANNPATQGMIDAATQDARRAVGENALPQLARSDALSGNTMSSKDAISQGVINRGLADTVANTSANIRGQQFNNGLQLAQQQSTQNDNALLSALQSRASAGGSAIGTGVNAIGSGISQAGGLFDLANQGGAGEQASTQAGIDNSKGMSEYANNTAAQNLQNFWNVVGSNSWGGTSNGTQTSTPSTWSTIASALGIGNSMFKLFTGKVG